MAVILTSGEVANTCDATTGFNVGNISTDDDNVEGSGAIGLKCSSTTCEMYTTTLGAAAPYDFSVGGTEEGWHIIAWFLAKTAVSSIAMVAGNGTDRGSWDLDTPAADKGGFRALVVDPASDFTTIEAGTWTTTGNPAQLTSITQLGGKWVTTTAIMGSFNNIQIDHITVGEGLRVTGGTVGSPNTFETIRVQDEDTTHWGWVTSAFGALVVRGKIEIGPEGSPDDTSVFSDQAAVVIFGAFNVAVGFYDITMRGTNTDVTWDGMVIQAEDTSIARWSITCEFLLKSFTDTNSLFQGFDTITLQANVTCTGTTFDDGTLVVQNGATLSGCSFRNGNNADGVALLDSDDLAKISNCVFTVNPGSPTEGHAIRITEPGTYTFTGNQFIGYGLDDTNSAAILVDADGDVIINVTGAGATTPTTRLFGGSPNTVEVNNNVSITLTGMRDNTEVRIYLFGTTTEVDGIENATAGSVDDRSFNFSVASGTALTIRIINKEYVLPPDNEFDLTPTADIPDLPISQIFDRNYENP
jgi:hypothetical protein